MTKNNSLCFTLLSHTEARVIVDWLMKVQGYPYRGATGSCFFRLICHFRAVDLCQPLFRIFRGPIFTS